MQRHGGRVRHDGHVRHGHDGRDRDRVHHADVFEPELLICIGVVRKRDQSLIMTSGFATTHEVDFLK